MKLDSENQDCIREQYRNAGNLNARMRLHQFFSTNPYGWYRWLVDHLLELPAHARILELGCGPATVWTDQIDRIPPGWQAYCSDFSAGMVQQAQAALKDHLSFHFCVLDAQAVPYPAGFFDAVIANHMLYHVPDREKAFHEVRRVLRQDGTFYCATNGERHMLELDELIWRCAPDIAQQGGRQSMQKVISAFSLENGAQQIAGQFQNVALELYEDHLEVRDAKALVDYIFSMGFVFDHSQQERLANLTTDLTQIAEQEIESRGFFHITKNAGLFIAY